MVSRNPSGTAFMMAFLRGFHAVYDNTKIFNDPLAYDLIPEEVREAFKQHLIKSAAEMAPELAKECNDAATSLRLAVRIMAGPVLARARFVEERLEEAIRKGIRQYIILGAGLDTFAYRRLDLTDRLQVFELDLPYTQEIKRQLLGRLNLEKPDFLHYIPVDFTKDNLASALSESKYDSGQGSFFSWMGVTHYLPLESVLSTLKAIIRLSSSVSEIVFDYYDKSAFDPDKGSNRIKYIMKNTKTIGETMITGFDPSKLSTELALLGLRLLNNLGPEEIQQKYFKECNEGYAASEHVHLAHATW
ncbi:methyltransferase, putative, TIGR00027 family [Desulfosporosinus orientis DSM 765]|uniref:S-adenosyl-L-methionine-dependent methyltransferase n=1 Tax=Desulfosporosinus orientis (strain ATCC 19365 / DSM 765 / NCIMB 8382 / VKM B-1628 / Singapore I) TaxID=768706 RepID=G7W6I1_DESOD|nr:class I SAM-dependent methyltransferase [Desulfosporosinus orientis]AET68619.1 methyltransferase, putative, TIGR00027 family [Desulfosporosinus orientis DSM 765]